MSVSNRFEWVQYSTDFFLNSRYKCFLIVIRMSWGGKRKGSGREKAKDGKTWNQYKKQANVQKLVEAAKSSMNIKTLFSQKVAKLVKYSDEEAKVMKDDGSDDKKEGNEEEVIGEDRCSDDKVNDLASTSTSDSRSFILPFPLPFFVNGCRAPAGILNIYAISIVKLCQVAVGLITRVLLIQCIV